MAGQRRAGARAARHASPLHPRVRPRHDDSHIATAIVPRIPNPRSETPARKSRNAVIASADSRIHAGVRSNRPRVIRYEPPAQKLVWSKKWNCDGGSSVKRVFGRLINIEEINAA